MMRLRSPTNIREVGTLAAESIGYAAQALTRAGIFSRVEDKGRSAALTRAAAEHQIAANHLDRAIGHLRELL